MSRTSLIATIVSLVIIGGIVASAVYYRGANSTKDKALMTTSLTPTPTPSPIPSAVSTISPEATTTPKEKPTPMSSTNAQGLKMEDITVGEGTEAKLGSTITVHYIGKLENGTVFQSSREMGQPATFGLVKGGLIEGWVQGIPGMKVGGKRLLTIPAALAYGANPPAGSGIPANANLSFEVELLKVQ